jgi:hypothetical protein
MKTSYQVVSPKDSRQFSEFLAKEGQFLLPMLELITRAEMAVDELIDVAGRATIEAVLTLSAQDLAGPRHPGRKCAAEVRWHGRQKGVVCLAERKLRRHKPIEGLPTTMRRGLGPLAALWGPGSSGRLGDDRCRGHRPAAPGAEPGLCFQPMVRIDGIRGHVERGMRRDQNRCS